MSRMVLALAALVCLVMLTAAAALDRPQVFQSWTHEGRVVAVEMPDENGRTLHLTSWHDPRFKKVLREGKYDIVWVR